MALSGAWKRLTFPSLRSPINFEQIRTTYVVERRHTAPLSKPQKRSSLRQRHMIYETLQDNIPKSQRIIPILLRKYVEDVGQPGEIVSVKEQAARLLIMTHKAAYPSKENIESYGRDDVEQKTYSSKYVATTLQLFSKFVLNISMSKENPWTIEPWHIRSSFRKAGVHVPEHTITMPDHAISGPDLALEGKEFSLLLRVLLVIFKMDFRINGQEKATVRCRIHHWATALRDKLPRVRDHWKFPVDTVFAEDKEIAKTLPEIVPPVFDEHDDFKPPIRRK